MAIISFKRKSFFITISAVVVSFMTQPALASELRVGYMAVTRPLEAASSLRPVLARLEGLLNKIGEDYKINSDVVRDKEGFKDLIVRKRIHMLRCEPMLCIDLMQSEPSLRVIAVEAVSGEPEEESHLVALESSEVKSMAEVAGRRLLLGRKGEAAGDYLPRFKLFKAGLKKNDFASVEYEQDETKRIGLLLSQKVDLAVIGREGLKQYKGKLHVIETWGAPPALWIATQKLDQFDHRRIVRLMPQITSEDFSVLGNERTLMTQNIPEYLEILEAWHVAWLFDQ